MWSKSEGTPISVGKGNEVLKHIRGGTCVSGSSIHLALNTPITSEAALI